MSKPKPLSRDTSLALKTMYEEDLERLRQARAKEMDEWSAAILTEKTNRKRKFGALPIIIKGDISDQYE